MNKEIITILDSFKRYTQYLDSWKENNKDYSMLRYKLNVDEMKVIEDCIYNLQHQLEEKDKVINEGIKLANDILYLGWDYDGKDRVCIKLLEILERGKNVNSK